MHTVVIVGGGASGMMTACISASNPSNKVILIEKNEKLGKKVFITGKGRCNVTNACDTEDFFKHIISNPKFMYSSIYTFDNQAIVDLLAEYASKVDELKNRLTEEYQLARQRELVDYPIFMAIAENIGYDATGKKTAVNELDVIGEELKKFISTL